MKYQILGVFTLSACMASATSYVVSTAVDELYSGGTLADETADGTGLSLREAISLANANIPDGDTVSFSPGTFGGSPELTLNSSITVKDDLAIDGDLGLAGVMTLKGSPGPIPLPDRLFIIATASAPQAKLVSFKNITLENGQVIADGGGILIQEESEVILGESTVIRQCTASNGGGVYNSGMLTVEGTIFGVNIARGNTGSGGAIYNAPDATLRITGANFAKNQANRAGGAIEEASGTSELVVIQDTSFGGNNAGVGPAIPAPGNGGALHVTGEGAVTLIRCEANGNVAANGGGAYWNGKGRMSISGGTVIENRAFGDASGGGGIYNENGRVAAGDGLEISKNSAVGVAGSGGGVLNLRELDFSGVIMSENQAQRAGGAIEDASGAAGNVRLDQMTFNLNDAGAAPGNGGVLHITGPGNATITASNASRNFAGSEGGAYWNDSGTMIVEGGTLTGNRAGGNNPEEGGGAIFNEGGRLSVDNVSFESNSATGNGGSGGAIFINEGATLQISRSQLSSNAANFVGGGIASKTAEEVRISNCTLARNTARPSGGVIMIGAGRGGGLHARGEGRVAVEACSLIGNHSGATGGGIWNSGETEMVITSSTISESIAPGGGGIYQAAGTAGSLSATNTTISGNFASNGAGVQIDGAALNFTNVTIASNDFPSGGPVSLSASNGIRIVGGSVNLVNTVIADNSPTDVGGTIGTALHTLLENGLGASGITDGVDGNIVGTDPLLEPLADNGGPTLTHTFSCESAVRNAGSNAEVAALNFDQRGSGFPRIYAGDVDMGALELMLTTYDDWAATAFDPGTSAADRLPDANPDGDARRNAIEYLTGSDPENGTDVDALIAGRDTSGNLTFSYDFVTDRKEGTDGVEMSTDLVDWTEVTMPDRDAVSGMPGVDRVTITLPSSESKLFARIFLNTP